MCSSFCLAVNSLWLTALANLQSLAAISKTCPEPGRCFYEIAFLRLMHHQMEDCHHAGLAPAKGWNPRMDATITTLGNVSPCRPELIRDHGAGYCFLAFACNA
jgi:hypothetical protein